MLIRMAKITKQEIKPDHLKLTISSHEFLGSVGMNLMKMLVTRAFPKNEYFLSVRIISNVRLLNPSHLRKRDESLQSALAFDALSVSAG